MEDLVERIFDDSCTYQLSLTKVAINPALQDTFSANIQKRSRFAFNL